MDNDENDDILNSKLFIFDKQDKWTDYGKGIV